VEGDVDSVEVEWLIAIGSQVVGPREAPRKRGREEERLKWSPGGELNFVSPRSGKK